MNPGTRKHGEWRRSRTAVTATLCGLTLMLMVISGCNRNAGEVKKTKPASGASAHVSLVIELEDGSAKTYPQIDWKQGMTVLDLLNLAKQDADSISFEFKGSGETAFLTRMQAVENQGSGPEKKNWQFWVNGKRADRSMGAYELESSDQVVWKFSTFPAKP